MINNLLLIDNRIPDIEIIINSLNNNTDYIIFNFNDSIEGIKNSIIYKMKNYNSIGLLQHNYNYDNFYIVSSDSAIIKNVETVDKSLTSWNNIKEFLLYLKQNHNYEYFDFIACSIYSNSDWKYIIDKLEIDLNINIRASTDITGSVYPSNWYLETDNIDLKDVYFTDNILNYHHILLSSEDQFSSYHRAFEMADGIEVINGKAYTFGTDSIYANAVGISAKKIYATQNYSVIQTSETNIRYYNNNSFTVNSGEVIKDIYTTRYNIAVLTTSGRVYSMTETGGSSTNYNDISNNLLTGVNKIYTSSNTFVALKNDNTVVSWGSDSIERDISGIINADITEIYPTYYAFYAKKSNNTIIRWGNVSDSESRRFIDISNNLTDIIKIVSNAAAGSSTQWIGLKANGAVEVWGNITYITVPVNDMSNNCIDIISNKYSGGSTAFAVLRKDGRVIIFGGLLTGGSNTTGVDINSNVIKVIGNQNGFSALKNDGSVVYWGNTDTSGYIAFDKTDTRYSSNCIKIIASERGFGVLKKDGSVLLYGYSLIDVSENNTDTLTEMINIIPTSNGMLGIKKNGKIVRWGNNITINANIPNKNFIMAITCGNAAVGLQIDNIYNYDEYFASNYDRYLFNKYMPKGLNNNLFIYSTKSYLLNNTQQINKINPTLSGNSYYYKLLDNSNNVYNLLKNQVTLICVNDGEIINEYKNNVYVKSYIIYNNITYNYINTVDTSLNSFSLVSGDAINLFKSTNDNYALGYQNETFYFRSKKNYSWYIGGSYSVIPNGYEPMRLDNSGTLVLNPINNQNIINNTSYWFDASGFVRTDTDNSGNSYKIALKIENGIINMGNSYLIGTSDERIKENIKLLDKKRSYEIIKNLSIVSFDYKDKINMNENNNIGFIAQNINNYLPEAIKTSEYIIPNIYRLIEVNIISQDILSVLIPNDINLQDITNENNLIYFYDNNNIKFEGIIINKNNNVLLIKTNISKLNISNNKLFFYGVKINNLLNINKDKIYTIFASATQQLIIDKENLELKVNNLQNQINLILLKLSNNNIN